MAVLAGSRDEGDVSAGVIGRIGSMTRDDGTPVFTPSTAASALVFFVLAMQCLPTLTVTRRETGSVKYAAIQLVYVGTRLPDVAPRLRWAAWCRTLLMVWW